MQSAAELAEQPEQVEVVLYVDEDDPASHHLQVSQIESKIIVGPRTSMGACNSACLENSVGDIVMLCNDDIVVRTHGWDRKLRETDESFSDRIYLAYPNDLFKGRRLCTFPILSRQSCELLGDPFPRSYKGAFIDYHLLDVFKRLERRGYQRLLYLRNVIFEHMHYRTGKAAFDETYQRRARFADDDVFLLLREERSRSAKILLRRINLDAPMGKLPSGSAVRQPRMTLLGRIFDLAQALLGDVELPVRWRGFLFSWFVARTLAARGHLPRSWRPGA